MLNNLRVWAEINLDAIAKNTEHIKQSLPENCRLMAVVKADGYGHGAVETAKVALFNGADSLGVAIVDEGISIREHNIYEPVLILGYTPVPRLPEVIKYQLMQTIFNIEMAVALDQAAKKLGKTAEIHIKIDTGLSRLGFLPNEKSLNEIIAISRMDHIKIVGIYTHFAQSTDPNSAFTEEQYDHFNAFVKALEKHGLDHLVTHAANSGAICQHNMFLDLVRPGIILYGLSPAPEVDISALDLTPAMSLKTRVSYLKELEEGVSVSYGRTFYTKRKTKVATVPVGYADGYMHSLSNKGRVLIKGQFANIIGSICMDQMMVDVTDIAHVRAGDEIILIGSEGKNHITAAEIAAIDHTIVNEIVVVVGKRVPRVYMKNGDVIKTINL